MYLFIRLLYLKLYFYHVFILLKILNILLYPISLIYGTVVFLRNKFYDWAILKSTEFSFPVIVIGNLSVGGVGKTPHTEYLIRLFSNYNVATLSRGYKRSSSGFVLADDTANANTIGDEPLQFYKKFKSIKVAVDEKRVRGIEKLKSLIPELQIVLLDDAYQHRAVKPGINILITDYNRLYINDTVVPSGRLREWSVGSNRADIIIVSKTPSILSPIDIRRIKEDLKPKAYQEIFFSYTEYQKIEPFTESAKKLSIENEKEHSVLLVTGIAKADPLFYHLKNNFHSIEHIKFEDHHNFNLQDIETIKDKFSSFYGKNKIVITTEKDIMRLSLPGIFEDIQEIPIYYIPIEIQFHGNDKEEFDNKILKYVTANSGN